MYNRFYSFLEKKNLHILSNLVSNRTIQLLVLQMKSEMHVGFQKAFDTVDHHILFIPCIKTTVSLQEFCYCQMKTY